MTTGEREGGLYILLYWLYCAHQLRLNLDALGPWFFVVMYRGLCIN